MLTNAKRITIASLLAVSLCSFITGCDGALKEACQVPGVCDDGGQTVLNADNYELKTVAIR